MLNFVTITNKSYDVDVVEGMTIREIKDILLKEISFRKLLIFYNGRHQELPDDFAFTKYDIEFQFRQNGGARRIIQ